MAAVITNIHSTAYTKGESTRESHPWTYLDLSGTHLGVRVEELNPGATSSYHHYHTAEEEHVIMLDGSATLHLGDETHGLQAGDHICFAAGEAVAHHIRNTSSSPCRFLVFGERKADDVVFYPRGNIMLVKSKQGFEQYEYKPLAPQPKQ